VATNKDRMMINLRIDVDDAEAQRQLTNMKLRATNFRPVFWYAREELEKANAANFTSSGLPVGGWDPEEELDSTPVMRETGKLFRSLTFLRGRPNDIGRMEAVFGTNVEYAKFHQTGTRFMPKRQIVFEPPLFAQRLGAVAARYVAEGVVPD